MNTFFKTFLICLIATLGFLCYRYFGDNSYSPELNVNKLNSPFSIQKSNSDSFNQIDDSVEKQETLNSEKQTEKKDKYEYISYFYSDGGKLVQIKTEMPTKPTIESVVSLLLKGPKISETRKGIYTEIPPNVDLIDIKKFNDKLIVNLTSNFGNNGSIQSVENRVKQLSKTIRYYNQNSKIYLYINGKEVEYLGGDGVYIKQPLD